MFCLPVLPGCGQKADESKPIDQVKAEAEKMDTDGLRTMAMAYQKAITAKNGEVEMRRCKHCGCRLNRWGECPKCGMVYR